MITYVPLYLSIADVCKILYTLLKHFLFPSLIKWKNVYMPVNEVHIYEYLFTYVFVYFLCICIVICRGGAWLLDGFWIGWLDLLYVNPQLVTRSNTADLHTLQFTVTRTLVFSAFTSRILATDLLQSHYHAAHIKSSFHSPFNSIFNCMPILLWHSVEC
jgi:hypothetical protein